MGGEVRMWIYVWNSNEENTRVFIPEVDTNIVVSIFSYFFQFYVPVDTM